MTHAVVQVRGKDSSLRGCTRVIGTASIRQARGRRAGGEATERGRLLGQPEDGNGGFFEVFEVNHDPLADAQGFYVAVDHGGRHSWALI